MRQLLTWLMLLGVSGSLVTCGSKNGPLIDICLVDGENKNFSCSNLQRRWILTMDEGKDLICASPLQTQRFLVNCHKGKIVKIEKCRYSPIMDKFKCFDDDGLQFSFPIAFGNNYVCVSELHQERIIARCIMPKD